MTLPLFVDAPTRCCTANKDVERHPLHLLDWMVVAARRRRAGRVPFATLQSVVTRNPFTIVASKLQAYVVA